MKFKNIKTAFHITYRKNLPFILKKGLLSKIPEDYQTDQKGVYLFPTLNAAEDAIYNWLGDRIDENEEIIALEVNITGLETHIVKSVEWELISLVPIEPKRILRHISI